VRAVYALLGIPSIYGISGSRSHLLGQAALSLVVSYIAECWEYSVSGSGLVTVQYGASCEDAYLVVPDSGVTFLLHKNWGKTLRKQQSIILKSKLKSDRLILPRRGHQHHQPYKENSYQVSSR
jgi:hypothetical protein